MNRFLLLLTFTVLCAGPTNRANAWNEFGHMAVAKLAYDQVDDGLKLKVAKLLKAHPHYDEYLAKNCPEGVAVEEWAFLRASIWADWVRPRRDDTRGERVLRYNRPADHYVNIPFILPVDQELFKDLQRDLDQQDILGAFKQRVTELKLAQTTAEEKAIALCWILHLIGDVHQPLHCATLYSADFKRGDLGGNSFGLRVGGRGWKLHAFWDYALGEVDGSDEDPPERQGKLYKKLKEKVEELRAPEYSREQLPEIAKHIAFPSWVQESNQLAKEAAYLNGMLKGVRLGPSGSVPAGAPEAGTEYATAARALARKRVVLAGHRLADKLKAIVPTP